MSSYEKIIYDLLSAAHLEFIQEKQFKDFRNGLLRYDFYLPTINAAIEVNGPQHYEFNKFFFKKNSDFTKSQERDRQKISYCLAHGIKLYIIPYWEIESIKTINDIFQSQFLASSKFHNDEIWRQQKLKNPS